MASAQITQQRGPTGNLVFQNSTGDTVLNISEQGGLPGFFAQGECASDEAIKTINPDGSYECNQISSTTQAEGLSETLAAGNAANQSIDLGQNSIENLNGLEFNESIEIGNSASAQQGGLGGQPGIAVGGETNAYFGSVSLGNWANEGGGSYPESTVIGALTDLNAEEATILGHRAQAGGKGSVAIGHDANSPNPGEATFGNLQGEELDLNVTGNATIHGSGGLDMPNGIEIGGSETLNQGGDGIAIGNGAKAYAQAEDPSLPNNAIAIGDMAETGGNTGQVVVGQGAEATAASNAQTAIGQGATVNSFGATSLGAYAEGIGISIGESAQAKGQWSVAIGNSKNDGSSDSSKTTAYETGSIALGPEAQAPNPYEATFGNLNGDELDLNVTGNATIHGSGGLDMESNNIESVNRIHTSGYTVIGDSDSNIDGGFGMVIGSNATAGKEAVAGLEQSVALGPSAYAVGGNGGMIALGDKAISKAPSGTEDPSIAIGADSFVDRANAIALGSSSEARASGAVAIGSRANAPNSYEATFGNLNGDELDLNVTGNATVHGSGGLNVTGGDVVADDVVSRSGADLAEVYSAERDYEPGTVVSISSGESDVEASSRFEDVAGVVSTDPGFTLNSGEEGVEVALEGRVPVKVSEKVEKGEDLAAGSNGRAVACETSDVSLGENSTKAEIVDAVNSLSSNQDCLSASFGEALSDSEDGMVEVLLD